MELTDLPLPPHIWAATPCSAQALILALQGRIHELEARVEQHEALVQRASGIAALAGFLGAMIHVAIDYLRRTHP